MTLDISRDQSYDTVYKMTGLIRTNLLSSEKQPQSKLTEQNQQEDSEVYLSTMNIS
jgi:hypothetical protein